MSASEPWLPVLALRSTVVLPGVGLQITLGGEAALHVLQHAMREPARRLFVVAQREPLEGEVDPRNLHQVGVLGEVAEYEALPDGVRFVLQADVRARALEYREQDGVLLARFEEVPDVPPDDPDAPEFLALVTEVRLAGDDFSTRHGAPMLALKAVLAEITTPGRLADVLGYHLPLAVAEAQRLLETPDVRRRLTAVLMHTLRHLEIDDAREEIRSKVTAELQGRQREAYLREQLRAIESELGSGADEDLADLTRRLGELELPGEVRAEVERALEKARRVSPESADGQVNRSWLEYVVALPWNVLTEDQADVARAREILEEDHHGLAKVKQRVLEYLAVRQLQLRDDAGEPGDGRPIAQGPILLFLGPPGTGKTSIARSIARALDRRYARVSLGGARDEADIRGHRRTYVGARAGRILEGIRRAGSRNPVFCLDEVDKLGISFQGDPAAALLEVLDPEQNDSFVDHYLDLPFDLSQALFICTANFRMGIPATLWDRMEVIEFPGYVAQEKREIARRFLLPREMRRNGLREDELDLTDAALERILNEWTREAGVRQLERELASLCRKVALRLTETGIPRLRVDTGDLKELLGKARVHPARRLQEAQIGVATGMYYTHAGGDIMIVEVSATPSASKGSLALTGSLGEVMQESALAALTYARRRALTWDIDLEELSNQDIHIHVPEGAVPKEGPSAGLALATALISELSGRAVRPDVAMTGEITLRGEVLPIGGVKEKLLGADRAGIPEVILPRDNHEDLEDLPGEVRDRLQVHLVDTIEEALEIALA